ncbi:hypothetical protein GCM10023191_027080 [Actinoallomurus oryzae]|uniref:DUF559 domain-containing protein n=1 Tax=Actinoallomurus oryzae TaxID=502180 RepID=A0ABP8PUA0_9ACTN
MTHDGQPTLIQRIIAALLYAGPGSVLTGSAALWRHGVAGRYDLEHIDVLVPHERRRSSVGYVRITRSRRMPSLTGEGLPCAPVHRAVADACRGLDRIDAVRAIVAAAVQQRKCSLRLIVAEVADGPMKNSALLREVVGEVVAGVRSVAEGQGRSVLRKARLPEAQWNADLYTEAGEWLGRPDAWWADAGVALEIDSREWHLDPASWERTMERHALMTRRGILVVHASPNLIRHRPEEFITRVRDALKAGRTRGPVSVRAQKAV